MIDSCQVNVRVAFNLVGAVRVTFKLKGIHVIHSLINQNGPTGSARFIFFHESDDCPIWERMPTLLVTPTGLRIVRFNSRNL